VHQADADERQVLDKGPRGRVPLEVEEAPDAGRNDVERLGVFARA
jgi:hypothetical protein